jgi:hypothetical protein
MKQKSASLKNRRIPTPRRKFSDPVPDAPPAGFVARVVRRPIRRQVHETLQCLFESRPIWGKRILRVFFPKREWAIMSQILHAVSFIFSNGPWRGLLIRYGYDPRQQPEAGQYQVMSIHTPPHILQRIVALQRRPDGLGRVSRYPHRLKDSQRVGRVAGAAPGPFADPLGQLPMAPDALFDFLFLGDRFNNRISTEIFAQWSDIADDELQQRCKAPDATECQCPVTGREVHGWFTKKTLLAMRARLRHLLEVWSLGLGLQRDPAAPDPVGDSGGAGTSAGPTSILKRTEQFPSAGRKGKRVKIRDQPDEVEIMCGDQATSSAVLADALFDPSPPTSPLGDGNGPAAVDPCNVASSSSSLQ